MGTPIYSLLSKLSRIITFAYPKEQWGVSSVGSERMLDRHEVTGSIPVHPTGQKAQLTIE